MTIYRTSVNVEVLGTRHDGYLVEDVLDNKTQWVIPHMVFEKYYKPIQYEEENEIYKKAEKEVIS